MTKAIIIILFVAMVISLGAGLYHLLKTPDERDKGDKVVKSLTWRIGIWVVLFAFILIAIKMQWLQPSNSVNPINFNQQQQQRIDQQEGN
ncbi:MAG: twin transmembrane helix small protein [Arenicella sp.]|nr:twin transmembrane helix small protein [Arenicella sp.]